MTYKILFISILISLIIYLSYKLGKTKKELEIIKEEKDKLEKEIIYVQETTNLIHSLNSQSVNDRLSQIASNQK